MDKWIYTILDIIFFVPVFILIFWLYGKRVGNAIRLALAGLIFSLFGYFLTEYFATIWGAWAYYMPHTFGIIIIGKSVVETLIWAMLVGVGFALFVSYFAEKEENKDPFFKRKSASRKRSKE